MSVTTSSPDLLPRHNAAQLGASFVAGSLSRYTLALLYALALCFAYEILSRWWGYFGFTYKLNSDWMRVAACVVAALPAILLHPRPRTFAQASGWLLYVLVFLPCLLVPVMQFSSSAARLGNIFSATFIGCVAFLLIVRGEVRRIDPRPLPPRLFWGVLFGVWLVLIAAILVSFGGSFQFVGADDIYSQRFAGADVATNPVIRYGIAILVSAIDPFLIAFGLFSRRYWVAGAGAAAQVVMFGTLAARSVLLSPFIVVGAYMLKDTRGGMRGSLLLIGLLGIFVITAPLLAVYNPIGGGLNELMTFIYLRTFLISGATFGVYEQFFSVFPLTYFSNSNIVALFVHYPYGYLSVGQAVQQFLIPISGPDIGELNANFLATDGLAALGIVGILVSSVATALVLRLMSKFVAEDRTMLMLAAGTGFLLSLANTSLLTSLVTGGGVLLVAMVFFSPQTQR